MNERLPYEDQLTQQLADLPLPDENKAWEDMRHRLEEDDDNRVIPFWLRGCGLWGLLAVVLLGLGWWLLWHKKDSESGKVKKQELPSSLSQPGNGAKRNSDTLQTIHAIPGEKAKSNDTGTNGYAQQGRLTTGERRYNRKPSTGKTENVLITTPGSGIQKDTVRQTGLKQQKKKSRSNMQEKKTDGNEEISIVSTPPAKKITDPTGNAQRNQPPTNDRKDTVNREGPVIIVPANPAKTDTSRVAKDSTAKKDTVQAAKNDNKQKTDSAKAKFIYFSAGLALHQQVPVNGQTLTPYNAQGRKGSLADYIPAVYFRMNKNDKWFVQGEFRYGAPQYTREILYKQKGVLDTVGSNLFLTTTSTTLKKTFYHQLPVSFNYFVLPNWSVGGGLSWNKFTAAIAEQDMVRRDFSTGIDTVIGHGIRLNNRKADSNFATSYFQAIIETQYKWRRLSVGARYSFGLQPYLKFTLPGGAQQEERSSSLQVFLRYDFWRSKKKIKR